MLILTRRIQETLRIGDDIKITVLGVKGAQVRIGIDAPRSVAVDREEVHLRKQAGVKIPQTGAFTKRERIPGGWRLRYFNDGVECDAAGVPLV